MRIVISAAISARPMTQMHPEKVVDEWIGERGVFVPTFVFGSARA
jgi:hypothetical protein